MILSPILKKKTDNYYDLINDLFDRSPINQIVNEESNNYYWRVDANTLFHVNQSGDYTKIVRNFTYRSSFMFTEKHVSYGHSPLEIPNINLFKKTIDAFHQAREAKKSRQGLGFS